MYLVIFEYELTVSLFVSVGCLFNESFAILIHVMFKRKVCVYRKSRF